MVEITNPMPPPSSSKKRPIVVEAGSADAGMTTRSKKKRKTDPPGPRGRPRKIKPPLTDPPDTKTVPEGKSPAPAAPARNAGSVAESGKRSAAPGFTVLEHGLANAQQEPRRTNPPPPLGSFPPRPNGTNLMPATSPTMTSSVIRPVPRELSYYSITMPTPVPIPSAVETRFAPHPMSNSMLAGSTPPPPRGAAAQTPNPATGAAPAVMNGQTSTPNTPNSLVTMTSPPPPPPRPPPPFNRPTSLSASPPMPNGWIPMAPPYAANGFNTTSTPPTPLNRHSTTPVPPPAPNRQFMNGTASLSLSPPTPNRQFLNQNTSLSMSPPTPNRQFMNGTTSLSASPPTPNRPTVIYAAPVSANGFAATPVPPTTPNRQPTIPAPQAMTGQGATLASSPPFANRSTATAVPPSPRPNGYTASPAVPPSPRANGHTTSPPIPPSPNQPHSLLPASVPTQTPPTENESIQRQATIRRILSMSSMSDYGTIPQSELFSLATYTRTLEQKLTASEASNALLKGDLETAHKNTTKVQVQCDQRAKLLRELRKKLKECEKSLAEAKEEKEAVLKEMEEDEKTERGRVRHLEAVCRFLMGEKATLTRQVNAYRERCLKMRDGQVSCMVFKLRQAVVDGIPIAMKTGNVINGFKYTFPINSIEVVAKALRVTTSAVKHKQDIILSKPGFIKAFGKDPTFEDDGGYKYTVNGDVRFCFDEGEGELRVFGGYEVGEARGVIEDKWMRMWRKAGEKFPGTQW